MKKVRTKTNKDLLHIVSEVIKLKQYSAGLVATVYYLHFERGWKPSKIAKSLGISLSSVYTILSYIRKAVENVEAQAEPIQTPSSVAQLPQTQPMPQEQQQIQRRTIIDILRGGKRG